MRLRKGLRCALAIIVLSALLLAPVSVRSQNAEGAAVEGRFTIADLVDDVGGGVVSIGVIYEPEDWPFGGDEFLEDFFDPDLPGPPVYPEEASGSGFVYDADGYILTNAHVIAEADELAVTFPGGETVDEVEVIGSDAATDLAVLQVPPEKVEGELKVLETGDSEEAVVGEQVVAIGYPLGLELEGEHTVTTGILSATERSLEVEGRVFEDFLQTDAPINPGNSGGPLLNLDGEVIGINTAIIPFAEGIGFALPINEAEAVAGDLIEHGRVIRGWLGVILADIEREVAEYLDLPVDQGALVQYIAEDSPADRVDLEQGDIIVEINGQPVEDAREAVSLIEKLDIGEDIEMVVRREDQELVKRTVIEKRPEEIENR